MRFHYTDGRDGDFAALCRQLDEYLNELAGGEENRAAYLPHNRLDDIRDALVLYDGGVPVGCAALRRYSASHVEVKRVFVRAEHRGRGLSRLLMTALEHRARAQGYTHLLLETGEPLTAAMGLYRSLGYRVIPGYGPYTTQPMSVCMEKEL